MSTCAIPYVSGVWNPSHRSSRRRLYGSAAVRYPTTLRSFAWLFSSICVPPLQWLETSLVTGSTELQSIFAIASQSRRHLGKHLEQLALFSLPRESDSILADDDGDSNNAVIDECDISFSSLSNSQDASVQNDEFELDYSHLFSYPAAVYHGH